MEQNNKKCLRCGEEKPVEDFQKDMLPDDAQARYKYSKDSFDSYCSECTKTLVKKREEEGKKADGYVPIDLRKAKLFAFWQSIPAIVKGNKYLKKAKDRALSGLGNDDEMVEKLVACKSVRDVCKVLDITYTTAINYRDSEFVKKWTEKFDTHNNVMRFKKDVDYAFTKATIKHADAARYKLWYQIHMGWVPEEKKTHEMDETSINKIESQLRDLAMKNKDIIEAEEGELEEDEEKLLKEAEEAAQNE
ncbi:MAG: hypothetical protein ACOC5D_02785 [Thermoplasmatota archaeon]